MFPNESLRLLMMTNVSYELNRSDWRMLISRAAYFFIYFEFYVTPMSLVKWS
jgi:hypothetical protein